MATKAYEANCGGGGGQMNGPNVGGAVPSIDLAMEMAEQQLMQRRPYSAPNWSGAWPMFGILPPNDGGGPFDLPGSVPPGAEPLFDPSFFFPPPPPRYSSLLDVPPVGAPRMPPPPPNGARRASSHFPGGFSSSSPTASSNNNHRFIRSPPPPYCSPNG